MTRTGAALTGPRRIRLGQDPGGAASGFVSTEVDPSFAKPPPVSMGSSASARMVLPPPRAASGFNSAVAHGWASLATLAPKSALVADLMGQGTHVHVALRPDRSWLKPFGLSPLAPRRANP